MSNNNTPEHIWKDVEQCESADRWNEGVPFKSRWERKLYEGGFSAGWDAARAFISGAPDAANAGEPAPDYVAWGLCSRLNAALEAIGDYAHEHSTGPAVPDALWEVRRMAYDAMEDVAEPCPRGDQKPEPSCTNRHQCWEPCGELGKSAEHARVLDVAADTPDHVAGVSKMILAADESTRAPDGPESWPIAKLTVRDGKVSASLYAPGLPDGEFDVWLPETRFAAASRDGCSRHEGCVYPHCACDPDSWDAPACAAPPSGERPSAPAPEGSQQ